MDDILPTYSAVLSGILQVREASPPPYTPPSEPVVITPADPSESEPESANTLVSIAEIKGHLILLGAFYELRLEVEWFPFEYSIPHIPKDKPQRWGWFVGVAVERFHKWCQALSPQMVRLEDWTNVLPPVDVMMVWHAYMLNPRWYGEDAILGVSTALRELERHFNQALHSPSFHHILRSPPMHARQQSWLDKTGLPFDPLQGAITMRTKTITCPECLNDITVGLMNKNGSGYLQEQFFIRCPRNCGIGDITKEKLAVYKFVTHVSRPMRYERVIGAEGQGTFKHLPGANYHPPRSSQLLVHKIRGRLFTCVDREPPTKDSDQQSVAFAILKYSKFTLERLVEVMVGNHRSRDSSVRTIYNTFLSAYTSEKPYSLDLVGTTLRQSVFTKKMYDLGWTVPGVFDGESESVLRAAVGRYHSFLDLHSSLGSSANQLVPTLDIDLVWHTHQLMPKRYERDMISIVGRFLDHDDKVEGFRLSASFEMTCVAWKERFGVSYTHCGCPYPGWEGDENARKAEQKKKQKESSKGKGKHTEENRMKDDSESTLTSRRRFGGLHNLFRIGSTDTNTSYSTASSSSVDLGGNTAGSSNFQHWSASNPNSTLNSVDYYNSNKYQLVYLNPPADYDFEDVPSQMPIPVSFPIPDMNDNDVVVPSSIMTNTGDTQLPRIPPAPHNRADALASTHPSDHTAVHFFHSRPALRLGVTSDKERHQRVLERYVWEMKEREKKVEVCEARARKSGGMSGWLRKGVGIGDGNDDDDDDDSTRHDHDLSARCPPPHAIVYKPHANGDEGGAERNKNGSAYTTSFIAPIPLNYLQTTLGNVPFDGGFVKSFVSGYLLADGY